MKAESIEWQWDDTDPGGYTDTDRGRFIFTVNEKNNTTEIRRIVSTGESTLIWSRPTATANSAALVCQDDVLYVAFYSRSATGCRVLALNASSGEVLWETPLQGIGSIGHSKYKNSVQIRMMDEYLVIFGWEASGKYIEILNPQDGRLIFNRKVK